MSSSSNDTLTLVHRSCSECGESRRPAPEFDCRAYRDALGQFATGIAVVTAIAPGGEFIGLTINSFSSVSLEPPLILWSLARSSPNLDAFCAASHYAVNILSANQQEISQQFASRSEDRFAGVDLVEGMAGLPLLTGCCAWFECVNETRYDGGDHLIFIGRVERCNRAAGRPPLLYHGGRYRWLAAD